MFSRNLFSTCWLFLINHIISWTIKPIIMLSTTIKYGSPNNSTQNVPRALGSVAKDGSLLIINLSMYGNIKLIIITIATGSADIVTKWKKCHFLVHWIKESTFDKKLCNILIHFLINVFYSILKSLSIKAKGWLRSHSFYIIFIIGSYLPSPRGSEFSEGCRRSQTRKFESDVTPTRTRIIQDRLGEGSAVLCLVKPSSLPCLGLFGVSAE